MPDSLLVVIALFFLSPLVYLGWEAFALRQDMWGTLASGRTLIPLGKSLLIAMATATACAVLGTTLAVLVARTDLPGRAVLRVALALPLAIPSFVGATALLAAFGPGALITALPRPEGFWGAFIVLTLLSYPYVYLPVLGRLSNTAPSLEEAARQLGSSPRRTVFRIVLPQLSGSIAAGTMLVFLYALSDFGAVSLMRYDTITRAIFSSRLFDRGTSLTLGLLLAVLALLVVVGERTISNKLREVPAIGNRQAIYTLGRLRWLAAGVVALVLAAGLATPIAVFALWLVRGSATIGTGFSGLGDGLGFLVSPALNSILASVTAGVVTAAVVLPVALAAARRRTSLTDFASVAVTSVFALPGLVIALAIVFWAIRAPAPLAGLYQSFPLLILAYVLHFGAQSMRSSQAAIVAIPEQIDETARTLGVGSRRRLLELDVPLMAPGLIAGAGLVMLSTLKELPATLLLAPIGFQTLATQTWGAAEDGFYAEVGVTSLVLLLLSGLLTWLLILRPEFNRRDPTPILARSKGGAEHSGRKS